MSLLEKLSTLVDKIRSDEVAESVIKERMEQMFSEIEKEKEEKEVSEEIKQEELPEIEEAEGVEEPAAEESEEPESPPEDFVPDMVEIPNEEIMKVIEIRQKIARLHSLLGQMVEDYEKRRQSALAALTAAQNELESSVIILRDSHELPPDEQYTIVFPREPGASGAFVRAND